MTYWQVFAERCPHTWDSRGLTLISRGISICAHCRPFNTFEQAASGILATNQPGHSAYVVEAATSLEANRLVGLVFFEGEYVPAVHLIGQIDPLQGW
jgi:hypothetical protein